MARWPPAFRSVTPVRLSRRSAQRRAFTLISCRPAVVRRDTSTVGSSCRAPAARCARGAERERAHSRMQRRPRAALRPHWGETHTSITPDDIFPLCNSPDQPEESAPSTSCFLTALTSWPPPRSKHRLSAMTH